MTPLCFAQLADVYAASKHTRAGLERLDMATIEADVKRVVRLLRDATALHEDAGLIFTTARVSVLAFDHPGVRAVWFYSQASNDR